jgi:hypothetical protein
MQPVLQAGIDAAARTIYPHIVAILSPTKNKKGLIDVCFQEIIVVHEAVLVANPDCRPGIIRLWRS